MAGESTRNVKGGANDGMKAPPPPGQHPVKAATATATSMGDMTQGKSRQANIPSTPQAGAKVLQQSKNMPIGPPAVMACGLVVVATIAYFKLNTNKPDETAAIKEAGKTYPRT